MADTSPQSNTKRLDEVASYLESQNLEWESLVAGVGADTIRNLADQLKVTQDKIELLTRKWMLTLIKPAVFEVIDLLDLEHNWDGYNARPIDPISVNSALQFLKKFAADLPGIPRVIPMTEGRLQFEWDRDDKSIEIEFDRHQMYFLKYDTWTGWGHEGLIFDEDDILEVFAWFKPEET